MGFYKIRLPELSELKKMFEENPDMMRSRINKADALQGPPDSVNFAKYVISGKNSLEEEE